MSARILLVEDDAALLTILEAAVAHGGFSSEAVGSGAAAVEAFRSRPFDAVLIDLGLPDRDGGEVLQALREASDVPILVVSGRDSERDKVEALDKGADDFIAKPFLPGELLARIRSALRRHRGEQGPAEAGVRATEMRDPISVGPLILDPLHRSAELRPVFQLDAGSARSLRDAVRSRQHAIALLHDTNQYKKILNIQ